MDLKQLKALVTIAETANMTRAAEVLNIVQPALSRQISMLEDEVGAILFERGRQGMILNQEGKTFLEYARRILHEVEKAKAEVRPSSGTVSGIVNVGLLPSTSDLLSSMLLRRLQQQYPEIRITITAGYAGHLQEWLEVGEIDVALLYAAKLSSSLNVQPLVQEKLWFVSLPGNGLRPDKPVTLNRMADKPIILPSRPHGLRVLVDRVGRENNLQLHVVAETNSMSVQKRLVLDGHGYTILPSIAIAEELALGHLEAAPLTDAGLSRTIVLARSRERNMTMSVKCVMQTLSECIRTGIENGGWAHAQWIAKN
ncbi:LysR family transcriptional regulator [Advenella mimigardefordensis]|uniref:Transcriptional regulator, LysR family n=1 Tax=Advenella mimigardefordensis (strain DSM 17166 / LMG 22922 / DPN7) TaxID=1247726 RepID=W0PE33_ADVMD|nr:LysR substrate-binding domain-containing protein [Advenella mimigardefordensis]AHG65144.1 transcriptional regulator, LysR family [Advenella mimigardefordensis DPN7]